MGIRRAVKVVVSLWTWLEISVVAIVGTILQGFVALFTTPFDKNRIIAGRWFRNMGKVASILAPTWRFSVRGDYPRKLTPCAVVVSNHKSLADPFLISHLPWEMKWLGKNSLSNTPILGWAMFFAGDIPIKRGAPDSIKKGMEKCARYLQRGMSVCIFPEGTRSRTSELLPFKDGAFRLAIENQSDILPLAVKGTETALPKYSWLFGSTVATVTVGERIPTAGLTMDDLESLKQKTRERIQALLK